MKNFFLSCVTVIITGLLTGPGTYAQTRCAFDEKMRALTASDPAAARQLILSEESIQRYIANHPPTVQGRTSVVYNIPVVVHVMHTGGAVGTIYNPSDAVILGAINYLNQVFAGTFPGMEAPVEGGGVVNMELNFVMAQRTPACGATNGIDRVNASSIPNYSAFGVNVNGSSGCTELQLKDFARWNPADYYNIWVVNKIDGADGTSGQYIAGYAYFAGSPANVDGTVMLATQMVAGQSTLPHELGHAFNLYHPFEGSNLNTNCPLNTNCNTQGDRVCDTDPITHNINGGGVIDFSCRTGNNTCPDPDAPFTRNTESNFMSYTNCYTLFTNGQKARTQAAMVLPSRASLAVSLGGTPCGSSINFNLSADTKTENNAGIVSGCRRYTDYNYQLTIGAAPTATAVATLNFSGTAVKGVDYEVSTNGNFITPGNTLTFSTGSTSPQPFTIRVFDDAAVETAETAVLGFTLNNGGGNATIGATSSLNLTINDNDQAAQPDATLTGSVGTFNTSVNQPFRSSFFDSRTQVIYTAAELTALGFTAGNITSIGFTIASKGSTQPFNGFTIKLKNTASTTLGGPFESGTTTVFGPVAFSTVVGVNTIPITPFPWNGTSNLLVEFCFDNTTSSADDLVQAATSTANTFFDRQATNATPGCSINNIAFTFVTSSRPVLTFGLSQPATNIATVQNTTSTAYLGPLDDVYYYDGTGNIIARIKNLTTFDYGCTGVTIDRQGTGAVPFWNNNAANQLLSKSLRVVPAQNTGSGQYQLTMYYTAAEVTGWQTASGQLWANAQMVKVDNGFYVPDVTPAVPHVSDVAVNSATPGGFGINYMIRGDFNSTGFSGFGAGIPGTSACPPINVTNPGTTTGTVNTFFSQTFTQTGAVGGATFTLNTGTLPTGLSLSAAGVLSGTPTQTGTFPLTILVTGGNGCTGTGSTYNLVIGCQSITVTNPVTTTGTVNSFFTRNFTQTGSVGGATFTLNSGTLPAGISLSAAGVLSGTPTQTGNFPITVLVTDGNGCTGIGASYNLVIGCQTITVNNPGVTTGTVNSFFTQTFTQTGAVGGATFSLNSGTLPTGLSLSAAGVLSGTPTQTGNFPVTVLVTDGNGCTGIGSTYTLVINPAACPTITVTNPVTSAGTISVLFNQTFTQTGAVGGATFSLNSGTLPTGLSLSAAGVLSGTPTQTGNFPITVLVTDGNGCTGMGASYNLAISCQAITVTNPGTTDGTINVFFSQTFTQTGAIGGASFSLNSGVLPTGLTLSAAGVLSGTATQTGSFPLTVLVTDGNGCTGTGATYNLVINPASCATMTGSISGTTTAAQHATANSVITFTGSGSGAPAGTQQYTFTYSLSINGGGAVVQAPLTTAAGVNTATVLQSQAVLGTYLYTLISVTDNNSCTGTVNPPGTATVTVIVGAPDFTNSQFFSTTQLAAGGTINEVVGIRNVGTTANPGPIVFTVTNYSPITGLSATSLALPSVTIGFTTFTLSNANWTTSSTASALTFTSNPGFIINPGTTAFLGVRIARAAGANGMVTHSSTITAGTGGGEGPSNNNSISNTLLKN